jgi:transcriptional regulator with XRE-family HTH domain
MLEKRLTTAQIGTIICEYRKERQLTQEAFANELGVSLRTLVRWENGETEPNQLKVRAQLAKLIPQLAVEWDQEGPAVEAPAVTVPPLAASGFMKGIPSALDPTGLFTAFGQYLGILPVGSVGVASAIGTPAHVQVTSAGSGSADAVPNDLTPKTARRTVTDGVGVVGVSTQSPVRQPDIGLDEIRQDLSRLRQQFLQLKVELDESRLENSRQQMRIERLEMVLREHRLT